jgi:poly(3-hydroxybutyrate) depolymerase
MYYAYDWQRSMLAPLRALAEGGLAFAEQLVPALPFPALRHFQATCHLLSNTRITHERPDFAIGHVHAGDLPAAVNEDIVASTPFCSLMRFRREGAPAQPRVLVAAPLSGHFATLLAGTVKSLVRDHDVYLTDWHNMRDVPVAAGPFGFDDYVEHIIRFQEMIGPGGHVLAVCQPCVPVLAAVAVMAERRHPATPLTMTLMAGPIDTRISPTKVNELATAKPLDWFKANLITTVPWPNEGAGRAVYPGFLQLLAFMSMQPQRHVRAHCDLYDHLANGRDAEAEGIAEFYKEYFAVLDLSAEFYLETVQWIFQENRLAAGTLTYRGAKVDPGLIRRTALLTVEGERDDICAPGQTLAAHDLCTGLRPFMKRHHLQAGVGHYGVFSGKRWDAQVYPIVQNFILSMDETGSATAPARRGAPVLKLVGGRQSRP